MAGLQIKTSFGRPKGGSSGAPFGRPWMGELK